MIQMLNNFAQYQPYAWAHLSQHACRSGTQAPKVLPEHGRSRYYQEVSFGSAANTGYSSRDAKLGSMSCTASTFECAYAKQAFHVRTVSITKINPLLLHS